MSATRLILVGGFLGAGKTTLLAEAAGRLIRQGKRVGLLANDQAPDLVDTEVLKTSGAGVEEVTGGCFCCRFPDLVSAMERLLHQTQADVILAEPVGSCTDLSATVLQPLKDRYRDRFEVAPFSVLIDAMQVCALARLPATTPSAVPPRFPDKVLYIYEKQLEEADAIVLNKVDLLSSDEVSALKQSLATRFPGVPVFTMSALTGDGVDAWLDFVSQSQGAGRKIAQVDYDTYAAGEAALGWMNASAKLRASTPADWRAFATDVLEAIRTRLRDVSAQIAHLKIYLTTPGAYVAGNVTSNDGPVSVRGEIDPGRSTVSLLINARVHVHPDILRTIVEESLLAIAGTNIEVTITNIRSFFPGRPEPTYRYNNVV